MGHNLQEVLCHLRLLAESEGVLGGLGEQEMCHTSGGSRGENEKWQRMLSWGKGE